MPSSTLALLAAMATCIVILAVVVASHFDND